jgi:purine-binding chemotaxis protein CheW
MTMDLTAPNSESTSEQQSVVAFKLQEQAYALPIEPIAQIIEMVTITPLPQGNDALEGVINVRGTPVPVINLRRYLGLPVAKLHLHTPILLVNYENRTVGMIVDEVIDVFNLAREQIAHPSEVFPEALGSAPVLRGLVHTDGGTMMLLALEHLLSPGQVEALVKAAEALPDFADLVAAVTRPPQEPPPQSTPKRRKKSAAEDKTAESARTTKASKRRKKAAEKTDSDAPKRKAAKKPAKKPTKRREKAAEKTDSDAPKKKAAKKPAKKPARQRKKTA